MPDDIQADPIIVDDIPADKILTPEESAAVKTELKGKISLKLDPIKNDYVDQFDRGTVTINQEAKNFSYHRIIIPDGSTVRDKNFSQKVAHTDAIQGENITFIECNLNNVEIHASWTLVSCLAIHSKREIIDDGGKKFEVYSIERNGVMVELDRVQVPGDI